MAEKEKYPFKTLYESLRWASEGKMVAHIYQEGRYANVLKPEKYIDVNATLPTTGHIEALPLYKVDISINETMKVEDLDRFARSILDFIHGGHGNVT